MQISTSILNSNNREDSIKKLNYTKTKYIHIDVMDGKFVEDKQFTIDEIKKLNNISMKKLDIHLMVENPIEYIQKLDNLNIQYITFHIEVEKDINKTIDKIKELGYKVGISIKPNTDINKLTPYLDKIDLILIMSVEPGKGGQTFLPNTPNRIKKIKELITNKNILLEVDGGINNETISKIGEANIAVVGSYITKSTDYVYKINNLSRGKISIPFLVITIIISLLAIKHILTPIDYDKCDYFCRESNIKTFYVVSLSWISTIFCMVYVDRLTNQIKKSKSQKRIIIIGLTFSLLPWLVLFLQIIISLT